jgi:hypothetical protein
MFRKVSLILIFSILILSMFILGSCAITDHALELVGSWEITDKPTDVIWEPHAFFVFLTDASGYEIQSTDRTVFESGPVYNLKSTSFNLDIEEQTFQPELIGGENYAEYSLSGNTITITFYDDSSKDITFGTITATRE